MSDQLFTLLLWIRTHDIVNAECIDDSIRIASSARDCVNECEFTALDYVRNMSEAMKVLGY